MMHTHALPLSLLLPFRDTDVKWDVRRRRGLEAIPPNTAHFETLLCTPAYTLHGLLETVLFFEKQFSYAPCLHATRLHREEILTLEHHARLAWLGGVFRCRFVGPAHVVALPVLQRFRRYRWRFQQMRPSNFHNILYLLG
jgi:hypothetical protein